MSSNAQSLSWLDKYFGGDGSGDELDNAGTGALNDVVTTIVGGADANGIRFSGVAPTVSGLAATATAARRLVVLASGGPLVLLNEDAGSIAANRIVTGTGASVTVANGAAALLAYDATSSRWRLLAGGGGGGGAGSNLGAALAVFKDVNAGTLRHRTVRVGGLVSGVVDPAGFTGELHINPVGPGHINPMDASYGAVGDGATDDSAALIAAAAAGTANVNLPPGTYKISNDVTFPVTQTLHFARGAILSVDAGKTVKILGHVDAADAQHVFAGAGTVLLGNMGPIPVGWFGAVADSDGSVNGAGIVCTDGGTTPATPNAAAFEAAIQSLDALRGGLVWLGFGIYRLERTVIVDRPVTIVGQGRHIFYSGTTVICDTRVTGFRSGQGALGLGTGGATSGNGSEFRNLMIRAAARDNTRVAGNWAFSLVATITSVSVGGVITAVAHGFATGNVITVSGVVGATQVNATSTVTVLTADTFTLDGISSASAYVSGGVATRVAQVAIADADATHYYAGQLISVAAANLAFTLARIKGATTSGSNVLVISGSDPNSGRGMYAGQYLMVETAFTTPTKVLSIAATFIASTPGYTVGDIVIPIAPNAHQYAVSAITTGTTGAEPVWPTSGGTVTSGGVTFVDLGLQVTGAKMAANAATTLTGAVVKERPSSYARVLTKTSHAGTTTMTTLAANGQGENLTAVDIRDASAGIDMRSQAKINGVFIRGFEGPAVANLTDGTSDENTNGWQIHDLATYDCRHALVCHGQNSQAGTAVGVISVQSREWSIIEDTQAGNTYVGSHMDGGYGYLVRDGCGANIVGAYHEGGTFSSYSTLTQSVGGTGSNDYGGTSDVGGCRNRLAIGDTTVHPYRMVIDPDGGWESYLYQGGSPSTGLTHRRGGAADGATGWQVWTHTAATRAVAFAISDNDTPGAFDPGTLLFPRGFLLGSSGVNTLDDPTGMMRVYRCADEPGDQTFSAFGAKLWRVGDFMFVDGTGTEKAGFLRCTRGGKSAPEWTPHAVTAVGQLMRLAHDDGFVYICSAIGSAPHKTGAVEPTAGATITGDGDINWTRTADTSALFERIGGDQRKQRLTVDATPTLLLRYPLADGHVRSNRWVVTVRSADNSGAVLGEWEIKAAHKRIAGTAFQAYVPVVTNTFLVGAPGAPTVTLNGNTDVDLNVTGIAATDLIWTVSEWRLS